MQIQEKHVYMAVAAVAVYWLFLRKSAPRAETSGVGKTDAADLRRMDNAMMAQTPSAQLHSMNEVMPAQVPAQAVYG